MSKRENAPSPKSCGWAGGNAVKKEGGPPFLSTRTLSLPGVPSSLSPGKKRFVKAHVPYTPLFFLVLSLARCLLKDTLPRSTLSFFSLAYYSLTTSNRLGQSNSVQRPEQ